MLEYKDRPVEVCGHIVILCTTLDDLGDMLNMMRCSHLPRRPIVVVCPCDTVMDAFNPAISAGVTRRARGSCFSAVHEDSKQPVINDSAN